MVTRKHIWIDKVAWLHTAAHNCTAAFRLMHTQWRSQKIFMVGALVQGHMVVICIWCSLFVTSQFDVISMFPNQRLGEVS